MEQDSSTIIRVEDIPIAGMGAVVWLTVGGRGEELNLIHVCKCHLTKTGRQDKMAESGDYLLTGLWPLWARKIEKHRGEGGEEGEETAFL